MSRSLKKGIYIDPKLEKKIKEYRNKPIKTWARSTMITPEMIGIEFLL